jgi:hypothetical protein
MIRLRRLVHMASVHCLALIHVILCHHLIEILHECCLLRPVRTLLLQFKTASLFLFFTDSSIAFKRAINCSNDHCFVFGLQIWLSSKFITLYFTLQVNCDWCIAPPIFNPEFIIYCRIKLAPVDRTWFWLDNVALKHL